MTEINDDCLWVVRGYEGCLQKDFPKEHLGIGDRMILNMIVRKWAKYFQQYEEDEKTTINPVQDEAICQELEEYGFKPKHLSSEGDAWMRTKKKRDLANKLEARAG